MRILHCATIMVLVYLANGQKNDKSNDKFSIGLGVLAPSYRQKVGTGKELGAQIDFNAEGKGFSYTVSQGDPSSGKPYSSIQISRPAPAETTEKVPRPAPSPAQYQPPLQYNAAAPNYTPRYVNMAPVSQFPSKQYEPTPQQYTAPAPQYAAPDAAPQYAIPASAAHQYAQPAPVQHQPRPQYAPSAQYAPVSVPGVQYAPAAASQYNPTASQYRPPSLSYQSAPEGNLPQVAPQPFGGSSAVAAEPHYVPRYQSPAPSAYPNALAAPQTYNAPSATAHAPANAPQYIPSVQNVKYQYGSGAEPAFASQLSIFSQESSRLS